MRSWSLNYVHKTRDLLTKSIMNGQKCCINYCVVKQARHIFKPVRNL
jgi:hypothetical protein